MFERRRGGKKSAGDETKAALRSGRKKEGENVKAVACLLLGNIKKSHQTTFHIRY